MLLKKRSRFINILYKFRTMYEGKINNEKAKTAGIIIIGDEILKGDVIDTNSRFMLPKLHEVGVQVKKIAVIGDDVNEINEEVKCFSAKYNYVITTGGIGPTHDDVTFEAVSLAFNEPLVMNSELYELCCNFYKTQDSNYSGMKLARVPKSAKLTYPNISREKVNYPNVSVKNVFMFPGIPQLFQKSFGLLYKQLFQSPTKFYSKTVYVSATEDKIAPYLNALVKSNPAVIFGSYPDIANKNYQVKITIESTEENALDAAYHELIKTIPQQYIVKLNEIE